MFKQELLENSSKCIEKSLQIKMLLSKNKLNISQMNPKTKTFYKNINSIISSIYNNTINDNKDFISNKCQPSSSPELSSIFLDSNTTKEINKNTCLTKPNEAIKIYSNNKQIIKNVFMRTLLMEKVFNQKVNDLTISFTKQIRQLPDYKIQIKPKNINGGWTYFSPEQTGIVVYREEEYAKVLLHELIHSFKYEISKEAAQKYESNIEYIIEYNSNMKLINETFVELGANILNSILLPIEAQKYNFFQVFEYERYWSLYQAAKLIVHYGFDSFYKFLKYKKCLIISDEQTCQTKCTTVQNGKCVLQSEHPIISETTNFVSYMINRAIAMYSINEYSEILNDIMTKNNNNISFLFYINQNQDSIKFVDLILNGYTNKEFAKTMDFLIKQIKKKEFKKMYSQTEFSVYNTTRMTATELQI
jgi:hypothetical protein